MNRLPVDPEYEESHSIAARTARALAAAPMLAVCIVHAGVLIGLGAVARPTEVAVTMLALAVIHAVLAGAAPGARSMIWRDAASHVGAGVVVGLDGGTESPFFFWVLLFLAGQALRHPSRGLAVLSAVALAMYGAVVAATGDLTAASAGRFGLLVAYCVALVFVRHTLDEQTRAKRRLDLLVRAGVEAAPIGVALLDQELRPIYANHHAALLLERVEATGTRLLDPAGEVVDFSTGAQAGFEQAAVEPMTIVIDEGGTQRHVRVLWEPVDIDADRFLLVFAEDVTAHVAAGEERTRFLQAAAHQFRTPLTPVMAYAQMLAQGEMSREETVNAGTMIFRSAREIERVLDKLSALLRMRAARPPAVREVAVGDLLESVRGVVSDLAADLRIGGDGSLQVRCAPEPAVLALSELVRNGALHGVPPVTVGWRESDGHIELTITDAGPGPALRDGEDLAGVWSVRYQSQAVSEHMGTQLGLSQAVTLIRLAGGTLDFVRGDRWYFEARFPAAGG